MKGVNQRKIAAEISTESVNGSQSSSLDKSKKIISIKDTQPTNLASPKDSNSPDIFTVNSHHMVELIFLFIIFFMELSNCK